VRTEGETSVCDCPSTSGKGFAGENDCRELERQKSSLKQKKTKEIDEGVTKKEGRGTRRTGAPGKVEKKLKNNGQKSGDEILGHGGDIISKKTGDRVCEGRKRGQTRST